MTKSTSLGIWGNVTGSLAVLARTGEPAPGASGTTAKFSGFKQIVLPDNSGPIFLASLSGVKPAEASGLWSIDSNGTAHLVVQTGNSFEVNGSIKTLESISIFKVVPFVSGETRNFDAGSGTIFYVGTFTDKSWAILRAPE